MVRSIVAVGFGFLLIALMSFGTDLALRAAIPSLFEADGSTSSVTVLLLTIGYVGLYVTIGSYLAARLAVGYPMRHALMVGVLGLLFNMAGSWYRWRMAPAWYHVLSLLLVMVWAWMGGRMRVQELALSHRSRPV